MLKFCDLHSKKIAKKKNHEVKMETYRSKIKAGHKNKCLQSQGLDDYRKEDCHFSLINFVH